MIGSISIRNLILTVNGLLLQIGQQVYSDEHLKKEYDRSHFAGGMWDISDRASGSLWKATLLLFAGLLGLVAFILWSR